MGFPICYIDESGGVEDPAATPDATPLMVIVGLIVDYARLPGLTRDFLQVRRRFFSGKAPRAGHYLDHILSEVKGRDIRAFLRANSRKRHHAIAYLDQVVRLLDHNGCQLIGRVWIKAPGSQLNPRTSYTTAIQDLGKSFQHYLVTHGEVGLMLCDARMQNQDSEVSHSIFTQKHQQAGDPLDRLVEVPAFGHSVNHVGLQLADLAASAFLFPMAARTYCVATTTGPHVDPRFDGVKERFADRIRRLQYRYQDSGGRWQGGVAVKDAIAHRPGAALFQVAGMGVSAPSVTPTHSQGFPS
jgi:hypothetical protein